jgi:hypothetical protein
MLIILSNLPNAEPPNTNHASLDGKNIAHYPVIKT